MFLYLNIFLSLGNKPRNRDIPITRAITEDTGSFETYTSRLKNQKLLLRKEVKNNIIKLLDQANEKSNKRSL